MSFGEAIKACFSKYATFSGRARRSEFWYFYLFCALVSLVLNFIPFPALLLIWSLAILIPDLSVTVRRLHDIGKSGWNYLLLIIPVLLNIGYSCIILGSVIGDLINAGVDINTLANDPVALGEIIGNGIVTHGSLAVWGFFTLLLLAVLILWLVWMTKDSQPGTNKWGDNPKEVPSENV